MDEQLDRYWQMILDFWTRHFQDLDFTRFLIALAILLFFFVLRRVLTKFMLNRVQQFTRRTESKLDDKLLKALRGPVSWLPLLAGMFIALEYLQPTGSLQAFTSKVLRTLGTFVLFWSLVNAVHPLSLLLSGLQRIYSESIIEWLERALRWLLAFLGGAAILEMWGIKVGPILAGLGLLSVAVALGAQDLFKNLISGILILVENWFKKGDWIQVDGVAEGTVEKIGFRSTLVRRFDLAPVYVPNARFADSPVTNFSAMTYRRISWTISLTYDTTVEQLRDIRQRIEDHILGSDAFAKPTQASTFVRVNQFSESSIDIMLYCFTLTKVWGEWLEIKENLAYTIKGIVEEAGASFALPSRTVYMGAAGQAFREESGADRPEAFIPPGD